MVKTIDISTFKKTNDWILDNPEIMLVVKSQNQIERRHRMIESKKRKKYGRFTPSPTSIGLLVKGKLEDGIFNIDWKKEFREPRHIRRISKKRFLLTEINKLLEVNEKGGTIRTYEHPFFGYLHTIDISKDQKRALLVSSGYDAIIEIDLETGKETYSWFAWDNGYNPSDDNVWYTSNKEQYDIYLRENKKAVLIDPLKYGEQGVTTANRIAHPNAAIYDYSSCKNSFIVSIGHNGLLSKIDIDTNEQTDLYNKLAVMAHGIYHRSSGGMLITQTTKGEWLWLDNNYNEELIIEFNKLQGKIVGTENSEWIQQVIPMDDNKAIAIDANRGLIVFDLSKNIYNIYQPNENWCIQDLIFI